MLFLYIGCSWIVMFIYALLVLKVLRLVHTAIYTLAITQIVISTWETIHCMCIAYSLRYHVIYVVHTQTTMACQSRRHFGSTPASIRSNTWPLRVASTRITTISWPSNANVTFPFGRKSQRKESVHIEWVWSYGPTRQVEMIVLDTDTYYIYIYYRIILHCKWTPLLFQVQAMKKNEGSILNTHVDADLQILIIRFAQHHGVQNRKGGKDATSKGGSKGKLPDPPETQMGGFSPVMGPMGWDGIARNRPQHRNCAIFLF